MSDGKKDKDELIEERLNKVIMFLALFFAGAFVVLFLVGFCMQCYDEWVALRDELARIEEENLIVTTTTVPLASLDYSSEVEGALRGRFHLGYGRVYGDISEEQYYVAYEILEDGGKKLYKMVADDTIIYDVLEEGAQAYVEVDTNGYGLLQNRLYVPVGTITEKYDLSFD